MTDTQNTTEPAAAPETPVITPDAPAAPVVETPAAPAPKEIKLSDLAEIAKQYPKALEYATEIETKAREGNYSVEDATLIILHQNNALTGPAPTVDRTAGMGGSMDNPPPREEGQAPAPGTPEAITYYADKFKELEAKGEIILS